MNDFSDIIFNKENVHINSKGWQGDNLLCFIKKYRENALQNFQIEKQAYKILIEARKKNRSIDWFPELFFDNNKDTFILQYVGESLNQFNIPPSYKQQVEKIFEDLKKINIEHDDITMSFFNRAPNFKTEFTVLNKKIYLVDFGQVKFNEINEYQKNISIKTLDFIHQFKTIPFVWCDKKQDKNNIKIFFDISFLKSGVKIILKNEDGQLINFHTFWRNNVERKVYFTTPRGDFANSNNFVNELILNLLNQYHKKIIISIYYNYQDQEINILEDIISL